MTKHNNSFKSVKSIQPPNYPGGRKALDEFVRVNLMYPDAALKSKTEGSVIVDYDVDIFGKVISAKVRQGIGNGCDDEALRIVRLLKYPSRKYQGVHVVFHMHIIIHFRLPGFVEPVNEPVSFKYHYVPRSQ